MSSVELPLGSLQSILFLASILQGPASPRSQINHIRLADTLVVTPHCREPLLLSNTIDPDSKRLLSTPIEFD